MASFEFFRRNQKFILYTAGIFALLTFSISGAMMSFFGELTGQTFKGGSLRLGDGRKAYVTLEDHRIAQGIVNAPIVPPLIPAVGLEKTTDGDRIEILAALRRLAIEYGIDGSSKEVDVAVRQVVDVWPKQEGQRAVTPADMAAISRLSGDQYELLMRESMRISTFLRMFAFAADTSDAQLAEKVAREISLVTVRVATLDKKLIEENLKQTEVSDEELQKWLSELSDAEKAPYQDTNRVAVKAVGVKLAEFDAGVFAEELKDKTFDDAAIEARYNLDRELFYRKEVKEGEDPPAEPYMAFADVKDAVTKRMQVEAALGVVIEKLVASMGESLTAAVAARAEATKAQAKAKAAQVEAEKKLAEKPDDDALKTAATEAKAAADAAEQAYKEADAAVDAARRAFDLEAEIAKVTAAPLVVASVAEPGNADGLKDLPEFGPWDGSWIATSMDLPGDISPRVQNTKAGVFLFQVLDVVKTPMKEFAAIKDQVKEDYYKKKADEEAKAKLAAFEAALERLARDAKKTEIEQIEADHTVAVTKKFDEWKAKADADLVKAREMRDKLAHDPSGVPFKRWRDKVASLERELEDAESKRTAFEKEVRKETDDKIAKVLKEARNSVLDAAVAEAGLTIETLGPYRKDLDQQPRFQQDVPARTRFVFSNPSVKQMKEGESSDVLEDFTNRAHHVVVMEKIEPGTVDDVTRRELKSKRSSFESDRMKQAVAQSFTLDALIAGWGYERAEGEDKARAQKSANASGTDKSGTDKSGTDKPDADKPPSGK